MKDNIIFPRGIDNTLPNSCGAPGCQRAPSLLLHREQAGRERGCRRDFGNRGILHRTSLLRAGAWLPLEPSCFWVGKEREEPLQGGDPGGRWCRGLFTRGCCPGTLSLIAHITSRGAQTVLGSNSPKVFLSWHKGAGSLSPSLSPSAPSAPHPQIFQCWGVLFLLLFSPSSLSRV